MHSTLVHSGDPAAWLAKAQAFSFAVGAVKPDECPTS